MATYTWSASAPGDAANSSNWTPTGVPATGDDAIFNSTSIVNCNWNIGVVGTIGIDGTYTGQIDMSTNAEIETQLTFGRNNCITSINNNTVIKFTGTPSTGGFYIRYGTGITDAFVDATAKDNIFFKFEGGVSQLIVGGCYPHLQFDNGFRAQYNGTGSNYNVEWESMILNGGTVNQVSSTPTANDRLMNWITKNNTPHNTMTGSSFQITSTANTLFNGGYGTWTFQPTSRLPVDGHPDYNGWTFKFENWILDSVAGNGVFILPSSSILQLTNLTINQGVSLMAHSTGSMIHLVNRPTIHGTWGFFAIADGIYAYKNKYNLGVSFGGTGLSVVPEHRILFGKDNQKLNTSSSFTYNNSTNLLSIGSGGIEFNDGTIQTTAATGGGGGGGSGITVQDEGIATSATLGTTLNFVDGQHAVSTVPTTQPLCVEATGAGAVKTITIDGSKVRTDATDTLPAYLNTKLQGGTNMAIFLDTSLAASVGHKFIFNATNDKVKISALDTTEDFLENKLIAGSNITITKPTIGGNETLTIASTGGGGGGSSGYPLFKHDQLPTTHGFSPFRLLQNGDTIEIAVTSGGDDNKDVSVFTPINSEEDPVIIDIIDIGSHATCTGREYMFFGQDDRQQVTTYRGGFSNANPYPIMFCDSMRDIIPVTGSPPFIPSALFSELQVSPSTRDTRLNNVRVMDAGKHAVVMIDPNTEEPMEEPISVRVLLVVDYQQMHDRGRYVGNNYSLRGF